METKNNNKKEIDDGCFCNDHLLFFKSIHNHQDVNKPPQHIRQIGCYSAHNTKIMHICRERKSV